MSELLKNLNEQQLPVAKKFEGKFIVNAGAGSGKTSTIVTRTAYMIEQGINPGSILMFTFTRKAAMEMKERMIAKIGPQAKAVTICTYHAFSSMLLRRFAHLVGYDKNFTIADSDDTEKIIKDFCGKNSKLYDIAKTQIPDWKTHGITVDVARNDKTIQNDHFTIFLVYEKYQQKLRNDNMMDFGDLANYGLELISKYSEVQEYVWNKYTYVIADEFQDSGRKDWEYINWIIRGNGNLCAVMDNNQSIYAFRGADIDFLCESLIKDGFEQYVLEQNYRSTSTIVEASNSVVDNNPKIIDKKAFSEQEKGAPVFIKEVKSDKDEANYIVRGIKSLLRNGFEYKDIAILARTKKQFDLVEKAFLRNAIPYDLISGVQFCTRKEVKDLLCVLRLLLNECDEEALERIINIPKAGIGEATFNKLMVGESNNVLNKANSNLNDIKGKAYAGVKTFLFKWNELKAYSEENVLPGLIIRKYLELFDYQESHVQPVYGNTMERMVNVRELIRVADAFETIPEVLEATMSTSLDVEIDEEKNAVSMMTIHASKGLEFEAVFIIGGNESLFPHMFSYDEPHGIEEERRLWYVAMTRAKEMLMISYFNYCVIGGVPKRMQPSRFVKEIPSEYKVFKSYNSETPKVEKVNELNDVF